MPSFWDKLQVDGQEMAVYSSVPSGSDPLPAVVIAHPVSGVNDGQDSILPTLKLPSPVRGPDDWFGMEIPS